MKATLGEVRRLVQEATKLIRIKRLTLGQAEKMFPGCITDDIRELHAMNKDEAGYHKLGTLDGRRLLSCCYEIGFSSWSVWTGSEWLDLDQVDLKLFDKLEDAEEVKWVK